MKIIDSCGNSFLNKIHGHLLYVGIRFKISAGARFAHGIRALCRAEAQVFKGTMDRLPDFFAVRGIDRFQGMVEYPLAPEFA
jgi:hypothetical protein